MSGPIRNRKEIEQETKGEFLRQVPELRKKPAWAAVLFWVAVAIFAIALLFLSLYSRR